MYKLMEIEGRWIQISYKTIEINGEPVIMQDEIKIIEHFNHAEAEQQDNRQRRKSNQQTTQQKILHIKKSND